MKIYTKTGDTGDTGLLGGGRVPKDHARVAAYGDVDETNAAIGVARAIEPQDFEAPLLESIQRDLFSIGGQLAAPDPAKVAKALAKAAIDAAEAGLPPLESFVLPGGSPKAAALHLARTVCRRAERSVVALSHSDTIQPVIIQYLNRLSDLLFTLARRANAQSGQGDVAW